VHIAGLPVNKREEYITNKLNYSGQHAGSRCNKIIQDINTYLNKEKISGRLPEIPDNVESSEIYLVPITPHIKLVLGLFNEVVGGEELAGGYEILEYHPYLLSMYAVMDDEVTFDEIDGMIEFLKSNFSGWVW
jgi:hypothetical protein